MRAKFMRGIAVLLSTAIFIPMMAMGAEAAATDQSETVVTQGPIADRTVKAGTPAPGWFRNPNLKPATWRPVQQTTLKRPNEIFIANPYCRDTYGNYYWMNASANPASCTQGYVKYYDSRNSSFLGAIDVYSMYWKLAPSTAVTTAYNWCTNNWICSNLLYSLIASRISAARTLIRSIRWGL